MSYPMSTAGQPAVPPAAPGILRDQDREYPALAGCVPASVGKRLGAVVLDGVVTLIAYLLVIVIGILLSNSASFDSFFIVNLLLMLPYIALVLLMAWATFMRSTRVGGLLVGIRWVDCDTGRLRGGQYFLKQLAACAISAITLGIGPVIIFAVTMHRPTNRTALDRMVNLMAIDVRQGSMPGQPATGSGRSQGDQSVAQTPSPGTAAPAPGVSSVGTVYPEDAATRVTGTRPVQPVSHPASPSPYAPAAPVEASGPLVPQAPAPVLETAVPAPPGTPATAWPAPASEPLATPVWRPDPAPSSLPNAAAAPPVTATRAVTVTPPTTAAVQPSPQSAPSDETVLDVAAFGSSPVATLDDWHQLDLSVPAVLGRNPSTPASLPEGAAVTVDDPARSISKTHLAIGSADGQYWVVDLHSTNGTRVARPDGTSEVLAAGVRTTLPEGSTVLFGNHRVRVGR